MLALESSSAVHSLTTDFGGHSDRVTPVPIPNTEVKPASADGTWGVTPWESRTPPDFSREERPPTRWALFVVFGFEAPSFTRRSIKPHVLGSIPPSRAPAPIEATGAGPVPPAHGGGAAGG